jgi:hypothetical protein
MGHLYNVILVVAFSACSKDHASVQQSTDPDVGHDAGPRVLCPSDSGIVSETPQGVCEGTGSCALELQGKCGPGVTAVAAPTGYICECVSDIWDCTIVSGGFGLIPCPDAGTDD